MQLTRIFFGPEIVGEIAGARFEARLGDAHYIVVRDHLFSAVIGHRENASALGHERSRGAGERD